MSILYIIHYKDIETNQIIINAFIIYILYLIFNIYL